DLWIDLDSVTLAIDGNDVPLASKDATHATATAPALTEGKHHITAHVRDRAGNEVAPALDQEFTVDTVLPTATLSTPGDGNYQASITVYDLAGNTATATGHFTVDTQAPLVTASCPGQYSKTSPLTITGQVSDLDPQVMVSCAGTTVMPTGGSWTCSV